MFAPAVINIIQLYFVSGIFLHQFFFFTPFLFENELYFVYKATRFFVLISEIRGKSMVTIRLLIPHWAYRLYKMGNYQLSIVPNGDLHENQYSRAKGKVLNFFGSIF